MERQTKDKMNEVAISFYLRYIFIKYQYCNITKHKLSALFINEVI